jgi:hypothetical protein
VQRYVGDAGRCERLNYFRARHAGNTAALQRGRHQHTVDDGENIGHRGADDAALAIAQQAFGNRRIAPLGARQHLLEPV